jgi:hypothetical protein
VCGLSLQSLVLSVWQRRCVVFKSCSCVCLFMSGEINMVV